jgi:hypothetical protein
MSTNALDTTHGEEDKIPPHDSKIDIRFSNDKSIANSLSLEERKYNYTPKSLSVYDSPLLNIDGIENKQLCLLKQYLFRVTIKAKAHKIAEKWYLSVGKKLGFPPVLLSALSSLLGGLDISSEGKSQYGTVVLAMSSATMLFTTLNTYLNYGHRASLHHDSASHYSEVKSEIELFLTTKNKPYELEQVLVTQHEKLDLFETLEPNIHDIFINRAKNTLRRATKILKI